ncbi:MAG: rhomboid family intramembrane serine protease [Bacteroidales bacterium]|nr:rhomboid family intramembrane serine protease [Bacteroidales bacterium]
MSNYSPQRFATLPQVIKNLLIINGLFFLATIVSQSALRIDLSDILGLHYPASPQFKPLQFISYMFMHGSFSHIFFNMFALWMFGNVLENVWGPKRFLIYYFVTGMGAGLIHLLITYLRIQQVSANLSPELIEMVQSEGLAIINKGMNYSDPNMASLNELLHTATVGASGSVFGVLLAFGMMFPNSLIYIFFAIPVKAKWFVLGYGAFELYNGVMNQPGDNVAHFAHLGGMLFGFILIRYWKNGPKSYI